jgi:hypothetical protein
MAMYDFGPKPSWIENPPEGTMVTTAKASPDRFDFGLRRAALDAGRQFLKDRGLQSANVRNLQSAGKQWFDNETGTAYVLTDTSNARVSDAVKLPTKEATTKAAPTRPSAPIRERRASEDPLTDAISADGDDVIDTAGLEPRKRTRQAPAPTRESEQLQSPAPTFESEQIQSPAPTLQSEQVAPSMEERKRRMIDAGVGGLLRETATGKSDDQLLEQLMMDQLEIGEKARDVPQDVSRDIQQGAIDEYGSLPITSFQETPSQPRRGRAASRDAELQRRANLPPEEETIRRGTTRSGRVIQGSKPGLFESEYTPKRGRVGRGRNEALTYGGQQTEEPGLDGSLGPFPGEADEPEYRERLVAEGADPIAKRTFEKQDRESSLRDLVAGMDTTQRRSTDPRIQLSTERAEEGEISPVSEGVEVGLLSRIGKAITDNPELAASGAQLLGGLISNAAQNRAQRKADRTTDQRVARANLISAITGGRARPTVERAQADTGGFMSLDTLGKAFQGGGAAVKGELSRRVEEAERERKAGLDERAAELAEAQAESLDAYRKGTLGQREKEFNAQQELLKKEAEQALAEQGEVNLTQLRANVKDVDDALGLRKTGGYLDSSQGSKKLYNDMRVLFRQFEENPNPANINGIIQVYQRLFDPATVREGDVALLREAEGSIKQAVAVAQRLIGSGGTISTFTIEQMKKAADDVHAMQQAKAKADVRAYTSRLFSANERNVLDEYYDDIFSVRELPGEGEGSFISDLSGAKLNLD